MRDRKVSIRAPVQAAIVRGLIKTFARLSWKSAQRIGAAVGYLIWLIPNPLRRVSVRNVACCFPDLDGAEHRRLVKSSLTAMGRNFGEAGALWGWPVERLEGLFEEAENEELLYEGMRRGEGVLLLLPHVGNWEFLAPFVGSRYRFLALYRPPRILELEEFVNRSRRRLGAEMVAASTGGLRRIAQALQNGGLVIVLPDQEPLKDHGVFAPFFGIQALTMTLVGRLVRRYRPTTLIAVAERTAAGRFRIRFASAPAGLAAADPVAAASELNLAVERWARACADQYMWSYKRFRTRPPGSPPIY